MPEMSNYIGAEGASSMGGEEAAPMEGRAVGIDLVRIVLA